MHPHTPATIRSHTPEQPVQLANGAMLERARVAYQTWGTLNARGDNVIWVCHALTASSDVETWWPGLFGPGRTLDPERYFIVCANVLGGCYGSTGPQSTNPHTARRYGGDFPELEIGDLVEQQRQLADHLGVRSIELVLGASMGGFQVLEWARREPIRVRRIALIACSWRQPPQALAQARLQCEFIRRDPKFRNGHYRPEDPPVEGLALARQLGHLTYRCAEELEQRFARSQRDDGEFQVLSYLEHQGRKLVRRFDALSYLRLTEAMNRYDFAAGLDASVALRSLAQPALVVSLSSDQLYYPAEQARLAQYLPRSRLVEVDTAYGHDGFLVDAAKIDPLTRAFRDEPATSSSVRPLSSATAPRPRSGERLPLVVIGATGRVGRELLGLLAGLQGEFGVDLVGVANSRAALWQDAGLPAGLAAERLQAHNSGSSDALIEHVLTGPRPLLLVDCTASAAVARHTAKLLHAGVAVITPNKIAFAAEEADYGLLRTALNGSPLAAWSATVGAGLPILSTIRRLRAAGDQIRAVEASLSGTLGHVLTRTQDGASLLQALTEAVDQGLAEPDPRIDLGGEDVRRKLRIVLRSAGLDQAAAAIGHQPLLDLEPHGDWRTPLAAHEQAWAQRLAQARSHGLRLVYRARWSPESGAETGPALVPENHPLAGARGTENRAVIYSQHHENQPIVIAGAGAGIRITAAAVLADLQALVERCRLSPANWQQPAAVEARPRAVALGMA